MRILKTMLMVFILSGLLSGLLSACSMLNPPLQCNLSQKQYLFIVHSERASLVRHADGKMHLIMGNPIIYAFTDRPYRQTQHVRTTQFLDLWQKKLNDNFATDHPNAALAGIDYLEKGDPHPTYQEINQLVILDAATEDPHSKTLAFKLQDLGSTPVLKPSQFHHAELFIDNLSNGDTLFGM